MEGGEPLSSRTATPRDTGGCRLPTESGLSHTALKAWQADSTRRRPAQGGPGLAGPPQRSPPSLSVTSDRPAAALASLVGSKLPRSSPGTPDCGRQGPPQSLPSHSCLGTPRGRPQAEETAATRSMLESRKGAPRLERVSTEQRTGRRGPGTQGRARPSVSLYALDKVASQLHGLSGRVMRSGLHFKRSHWLLCEEWAAEGPRKSRDEPEVCSA